MIKANLERVAENIKRACEKSGRDPGSVQILAVSKRFSNETISQARSLGISYFGENRVQEARRKKPTGIFQGTKLALIGHLQTNKASMAVRIFDEVQSVDSLKVAQSLSKFAVKYRDEALPVYLQVNIAKDKNKYGCLPEEALPLAGHILDSDGIKLIGLMTVAPIAHNPNASREHFRNLKMLREQLVHSGIPEDNLRELSMGMSSDYQVAVEEGATVIRLGTALFGPRSYK